MKRDNEWSTVGFKRKFVCSLVDEFQGTGHVVGEVFRLPSVIDLELRTLGKRCEVSANRQLDGLHKKMEISPCTSNNENHTHLETTPMLNNEFRFMTCNEQLKLR